MAYDIQNLEDLRKLIKSFIDDTNNLSMEAIKNSVSAFLDQTGLVNESLHILKDEVQCSICFDIPLRACLTNCRHVFCLHCLDMCRIFTKFNTLDKCPMCRTVLAKRHQKQLLKINVITDAVMLKHNPHYDSWKKKELHKRFCELNTEGLKRSYKTTVKLLERSNGFSGAGAKKCREEFEKLCQDFLSLLEKFPCSEADASSMKKRKDELNLSGIRILGELESLGYFRR